MSFSFYTSIRFDEGALVLRAPATLLVGKINQEFTHVAQTKRVAIVPAAP